MIAPTNTLHKCTYSIFQNPTCLKKTFLKVAGIFFLLFGGNAFFYNSSSPIIPNNPLAPSTAVWILPSINLSLVPSALSQMEKPIAIYGTLSFKDTFSTHYFSNFEEYSGEANLLFNSNHSASTIRSHGFGHVKIKDTYRPLYAREATSYQYQYQGYWNKGTLFGKGCFQIISDGQVDSFEGDFNDLNFTGTSTTTSSKTICKGSFYYFKKQGENTCTYDSGDTCTGIYNNDLLENGICKYSNGFTYRGSFVDGVEWDGEFTNNTGQRYFVKNGQLA